jgi:uncharacterized membrane protein
MRVIPSGPDPGSLAVMTTSDAMTIGPVEYLVVRFPGNRFSGRIAPALADLVARDVIHIIDLAFVMKDADGSVTTFEYDELEELEALVSVDGEAEGFISDADLQEVAAALEPNSSAALLLWEDLWAVPLADALRDADAEVIRAGYVPHEILEAALAELVGP